MIEKISTLLREEKECERTNLPDDVKMRVEDFDLWYDENHALKEVDMDVKENKVTAIIGPSGCGKSTLIRSLNRMNDTISSARTEGKVWLDNYNIYDSATDCVDIRRKIGMVFQKPNPFPFSIENNVFYGCEVNDMDVDKKETVERCLKDAALWEEVHDRLDENALSLSGGQQQRLCIARALATEPEVLLMDEPASALDPIATAKIEDLMDELKKDYTVVIVTHNMQQAARISDYTAYMYLGELIEFGETEQIFEKPNKELTEKYITGRMG
ncbi:MAG: phosphate ABC transporter ATP-binding protein PstB [Candidatus Natronoplasma sp.]